MNNDDKTYKIYICGTGFEVSEKEYKEYYRNLEHSKYLHKEEIRSKLCLMRVWMMAYRQRTLFLIRL